MLSGLLLPLPLFSLTLLLDVTDRLGGPHAPIWCQHHSINYSHLCSSAGGLCACVIIARNDGGGPLALGLHRRQAGRGLTRSIRKTAVTPHVGHGIQNVDQLARCTLDLVDDRQ